MTKFALLKDEMFKLHGRACLACGKTRDVIADHIVPKNQGGPDEIWNLQPLCLKCNGEKQQRVID